MRKLLLLLLLVLCLGAEAREATAFVKKDTIIEMTSIDTADIQARKFTADFKKKYSNPAFVYTYRTPEKNAWERFKEWLANLFRYLFSFADVKSSLNFVNILLRILAVMLIIFVIYMIVKATVNKEGQWIFGKNSDKKIINYSQIEKNIHLVDFENVIRNTLDSGEKRLTIRYYYLWLLKIMAERNHISWDLEKTNSDYLHEIKSDTLKSEFSYASYLYNYIWYGEFELDDLTFEKAKSAFEKTLKAANNG